MRLLIMLLQDSDSDTQHGVSEYKREREKKRMRA